MIQIIPRRPSFGESLTESLTQSAPDAFAKFATAQGESKNYNTIKDAFGERFANVWNAAPKGGQTELLRAGLDAKLRGQNIDETLSGKTPASKIKTEPEVEPSANREKEEFPEYKLDTEGMTPKERVDYKSKLRAQNTPRFEDASTKSRAYKDQQDSNNILKKLNESDKLPEGLGRLIINPDTGVPYKLAELAGKVNPETQRWIKTINDYTTKAKDSYGARVTNFDLQQFMQRLPGLLNTKEGRRQIIRQMQISNDLDLLYENGLKKVFKKYGMGNIAREDAEDIVERMIAPQEEKLREEYFQISEELDAYEKGLPEGFIVILDPNGKELHVPKEEAEAVRAKVEAIRANKGY